VTGLKKRKSLLTIRRRDALTGLLFFLPWLIGFFAVTAYPLLYSIFISFNQVLIKPGAIEFEGVGLDYYRQALMSDTTFPISLMNSVINVVLSTPMAVVFALVISLLLNKKFRGRAIYRMIFFLPVVIMSGPVMSELMKETSAMTIKIDVFGIIELLRTMDNFWVGVLLSFLNSLVRILWFSGVQTIIFLAALQKIDRSMYEAASIDGATAWESFWRITLPYLKPVILLNTVYTIVEIGTFADDATNQRILGTMRDITRPYSYSAALSWLYAVLLLVLIVIAFLIFNDWKEVRWRRDAKRIEKAAKQTHQK
jgi:ABC-type sugar transport system permease subunit